MRKLFSLFLALIICCSPLVMTANAIEAENQNDAEIVAKNLMAQYSSSTLSSVLSLYNARLELEAYCFSFSPSGYVIVNANDYSIPEFSPTSTSPYSGLSDEVPVYNGLLSYYITSDDNTFIHLKTGNIINPTDITTYYHKESDATAKSIAVSTNQNHRGATFTAFTNYAPVTWSSSYYCVVDGCAIILKYLDTYHDASVLYSRIDTNGNTQAYLINNNYLPNAGCLTWSVPNGIVGNYTDMVLFNQ